MPQLFARLGHPRILLWPLFDNSWFNSIGTKGKFFTGNKGNELLIKMKSFETFGKGENGDEMVKMLNGR